MKYLLVAIAVFSLISCSDSPKAGLIRSGSGLILGTNVPRGPRLVRAKWQVMGMRKFKDSASTTATISIDSTVIAVQFGDTLRDKAGKPIYDSVAKAFKPDTTWTTSGLSQLELSYLSFRVNPQP